MDLQHQEDNNSSKLDGTDRGWAWVVLTANFIVQFLNSGLFSSLGVYLVEWEKQIAASVTQLSWVLSLNIGIVFLSGLFGSALCKVLSVRQVVIAGSILTTVSFIIASFTTQLWQLYLAFAFVGLGMGLIYQPSFIIIVYYFDQRLGRANSISQTGAGLGIFALPPLLQLLIDTYGWRGSLLLVAAGCAHMTVCGAIFRTTPLELENRLSINDGKHETNTISDNETASNACGCHEPTLPVILTIFRIFDFKLLKCLRFNVLLVVYFLMAFAYVTTILYLPSRAKSAGISDLKAASLVSALGIGSLVARLTHGFIIDYHILSTSTLTSLAFLGSGIVTLLNPVSDNYWSLAAQSVTVGLGSGVYLSTVPILTKEYVGDANVSGGIGWMNLTQGVAIFLSLYSTGVLVDRTASYDVPFYLAGALFCCSFVLLFLHPVRQYLQRKDEKNMGTKTEDGDLHGIDNVAVTMETSRSVDN